MIREFNYSLKILFKNKALIFWTFAFPLILGTFFKMAFSNIEQNEKLEVIQIAIVDTPSFYEHEWFKTVFEVLGDENQDDQLFEITYTTKQKAEELLEEQVISGYLLMEENPLVFVQSNGINETILEFVTAEVMQYEKMMQEIIAEKITQSMNQPQLDEQTPDMMAHTLVNEVLDSLNSPVLIKDISSQHLSYTMIEFYTLLAMTCLYGGLLGTVSLNQVLANMSHSGKRIAISPATKGRLILSRVLASYVTQLIGVFLLFSYTIFILHVDYGDHLLLSILLTLAGCFAGLSLGILVATCFRVSETAKVGIVLSITMLGCFLSGMMGITMKYVIDTKVPLLNQLNPADMITDGFYSLYYYETFERFYGNLLSLFIFGFLMIGISMISLRRQTYDHL